MRYPDCQREDGNCSICSLSSYNRDCHNAPVNSLAYMRCSRTLTQQALANASGINIRQIQRIESGDIEIGNLTLRNALALAHALGVAAEDLIN